jgi:CDP-diacylglycerol--glycerol-3-phosphate 3-phosphatidyltransferase
MTTANKITITRIILIPFFVGMVLYYVNDGREVYRHLAIAAFILCSASDALDGWVARRFNQRSELGTILDPLADKLLLVSGIVLLSFNHEPRLEQLPLWLVMTIASRDIILMIGWIVIRTTTGQVRVRPHMMGKVATVLQMAVVFWVLLKLHNSWLDMVCAATALCTGVSGFFYFIDGARQLGKHPHSLPSSDQSLKREA